MMVTKHAEKRMKERCGLPKKARNRMARKAWDEGIPHNKTTGRLNRWINGLYLQFGEANNVRIYGDNAYIFCDDILVTILSVPSYLKKDLSSMERSER